MKVAEIVTEKVIEGLKKGDIPWQKPWLTCEVKNFSSNRKYTGINTLLLALSCEANGYKFPYFATYNQITALGGEVAKGSHSTLVVFTKNIEVKNEEDVAEKTIHLLRYYNVFNLSQTNLDQEKYAPTRDNEMLPEPHDLLMKKQPAIKHGGNRAYFDILGDYIQLPSMDIFTTSEDYYRTAYHELTHWTGHDSRLKRIDARTFHKEEYSHEELVAEIGANMLSYHAGFEPVTNSSQAYINAWLSRLNNDSTFIITAASRAQKAYSFLTE